MLFQFANLFEHNSSAEWCLYISEWAAGNWDLSNIRVTTKVAVNALLGDTPTLVDYGSAIMHNLGTREVKAAVRITAFYNKTWLEKLTKSHLIWQFLNLASEASKKLIVKQTKIRNFFGKNIEKEIEQKKLRKILQFFLRGKNNSHFFPAKFF